MVGQIEINSTPDVVRFLDDLINELYKKEYFGFIESAEKYVSDIYKAIPDRIKKTTHKKTPNNIKYLGSNYIFYKANARTTWYVFFEKQDAIFLITGIMNNHCEEAKEL